MANFKLIQFLEDEDIIILKYDIKMRVCTMIISFIFILFPACKYLIEILNSNSSSIHSHSNSLSLA